MSRKFFLRLGRELTHILRQLDRKEQKDYDREVERLTHMDCDRAADTLNHADFARVANEALQAILRKRKTPAQLREETAAYA